MPNGIGQFAEGFTKAFGAAQERRRLRDVMQLEEERFQRQEERAERSFGLDVLQFENQLQQQERAAGVEQERLGMERGRFGLEQERFGLEQGRFGLEEQRFEREGEQFQQQQELEQERLNIQQEDLKLRGDAARAKAEFEARQQDREALKMLEGLNKIPKAARKLYMRNVAKQLQMDPNSEDFKELTSAISGMDPEELKQTTSMITSLFPQLPPGQGAALAGGFVRGEITLPEIIDTAEKLRMQSARQSRRGTVQEFDPTAATQGRLTSPEPIARQPSDAQMQERAEVPTVQTAEQARTMQQTLLQEADEAAQAGDNEDADNLRAQAGQFGQMAQQLAEFSPEATRQREQVKLDVGEEFRRKKPLDRRVPSVLGLDGVKLTIGQAEDLGYHTDVAGTKELRELHLKKTSNKQLMNRMDDLATAVEGREELVGIAGSAVRLMDTVRSQFKGAVNLFSQLTRQGEVKFRNNPIIKGWVVDSGLAAQSAVVRSKMVELAFDMAKANDEGRLSDQDFERAMEQIGNSGSVEQLQATLGDLRERTRSDTQSEIEANLGGPAIDLMTPDELDEFTQTVEDPQLLRSITIHLRRENARLRKLQGGG